MSEIKKPNEWPYTQKDGVVPSEIYEKFLDEGDTWRVKVKGVEVGRPIITHEAVERLARVFGVTVFDYTWLSSTQNDAVLMIKVTGFWEDARVTPEIGEVTLGSIEHNPIARNYPRSICWKRGYDRAVLKHLGIEAYSAEESDDFSRKNASSGNSTTSNTPNRTASKSAPAKNVTQQNTSGEELDAKEGQLKAIQNTVNIMQNRGIDITVDGLIKEAIGIEKPLNKLKFSEAIKVIQLGNEKMSEQV